MIHTVELYCNLEDGEINTLAKRHGVQIKQVSPTINLRFDGIVTSITKKFHKWYMFVHVDLIKLLKKPDFTELNTHQIETKLDEYLVDVFGHNEQELILKRIDYRFDAVVSDPAHREMLLKLYRKTYDSYRYKRKWDEYKSTLYFNSKSMKVIVYDKMIERNEKGIKPEPYEVDVLRFEVQLLNRHLNHMKRYRGISKTLSNYIDDDFRFNYLLTHISPFFSPGHFYKINIAKKIIDNSSLKQKDIVALKEFLCDISNRGLKGLNIYKKLTSTGVEKQKYSKYTIKKYLSHLHALNINPLLIPKNSKINLGKDKRIDNPLSNLFKNKST
ncbi:phage/plasmid replication domain-containing protein [Jeotgalibacillus terrae]|uniref:Phage/plasmid replication protein n=1 Tax=Jeotgalibacillus terrae TaxID=587735 RepID=A0ABW5ZKM4_9BACL|nr:phage/plasmid replication protein [Jeotgalibacillus terrae]MBM7578246.1 hypothetical protein [Jeotgalibacillus terrae]